jgi:glycosyltransferase involved in cell wall biosynthesis
MNPTVRPGERPRPLLTAIMPVYNGAAFLAEAIRHVLAQHYHPLEFIVVDDGSTDDTADIAAAFSDHIRYVSQPNQGPAAARNSGIRIARGEFLTFLDVDDLWVDGALSRLVEHLLAHPEIGMAQGLIQQMQLDRTVPAGRPQLFTPVFAPYQFINIGSAVYRKTVFDTVGLFDRELRDNEDTDWFMRAWEQDIAKVVLPEVVLFYRKHDRNMTLEQRGLVHFGLLKIYKRRIDRVQSRSTPLPMPTMRWIEYFGKSPDEMDRKQAPPERGCGALLPEHLPNGVRQMTIHAMKGSDPSV